MRKRRQANVQYRHATSSTLFMPYPSNIFFAPLLALSFACGAAQAEIVKYNYKATVTYTDDTLAGVAVGTPFQGSFWYDTSTQAAFVVGTSAYYYYDDKPGQFTTTIGGHSIASNGLYINVVDNFGGNVEDVLYIMNQGPVAVDGEVKSDNWNFGFTLASGPGRTAVLPSTALPTQIDVKAFDAWTVGELRRDGSQTGTVLQFNVDSISRADACTISYKVTGSTSLTFDATMTITNPAATAAKDWAVNWIYSPGSVLVWPKNARITQNGFRSYTASPTASNATVAAGGSASFSFTGSKLPGALPSLSGFTAKLGGQSCVLVP